MHLPPLIQDLAVILSVAALVTYIFHKIRQPVVLGYIVAGLLVGPYTPPFKLISDVPSIQAWADLGVIFLMFNLGLEFSFRRFTRLGASVLVTAIIQVVLMIAFGFLAGRSFGWSLNDGIFLGCMIAISSTTIIIKALAELKLSTRRFAEFVFGLLIVEDLAAILILVTLSSFASEAVFSAWKLVKVTGQLILVVGSWFLVGYFLIPRFVKRVGSADSEEMMTILSSGLCLLLVSIAIRFGYSPALGAFIMGSILAETREVERIERLVRPLRDLFAAVFFVSIGMLVDPRMIIEHWPPVLAVTLVVIGGKILSLMIGSLLTGQSPKNSVRIAFSMAQIGEFSFIIATLGLTLKVISPFLYPVIVAVSVITTFTTPYLIRLSEDIAHRFDRRVSDKVRARLDRRARLFSASQKGATPFWKSWGTWAACALAVLIFFRIAADFLAPVLVEHWTSTTAEAVAWGLAMLLSAPFVWTMWMLFRQDSLLILGLSRLLTVALVAYGAAPDLVSLTREQGVVTLVTVGAYLALNRRLEAAYLWFERQFLATFVEKDVEEHDFRRLAPWDVHLARFKVTPDSRMTGLTLEEAKLRENFGLNIVAIRRGHQVIVAPTRHDRILPFDDLLGLGTEEHLEQVRGTLEQQHTEVAPFDLAGYELRPMPVREGSSLAGRTIVECRVHEIYGGLVVGIERESLRILNPASTFKIEVGDLLLVVGDRERLRNLQKDLN